MIDFLTTFLQDDSGQGLVEYAMIIALVSIVSIAALQLMGGNTNNTINTTGNYLTD